MKHFLYLTLFAFLLVCPIPSQGAAVADNPLEVTLATFSQVPCMEESQYRYHKDTIRSLSYTRMRALRVFCSLPDITADDAIEALERLVFYPLSFDQVRLLETFAELPGSSLDNSWQLLDRTTNIPFATMQAITPIPAIGELSPEKALVLVEQSKTISDSGLWALKACFSVNDLDSSTAQSILNHIAGMSQEQHRAAEQGCLISDAGPSSVTVLLGSLAKLSDSDAANSRALFSGDTSIETAVHWLQHYFSYSHGEREARFYSLSEHQKNALLAAFSRASDYSIRKINDLHAVTDKYGGEISTGTLVSSDRSRLESLFNRLHPEARKRFQEDFQQALDASQRYETVKALKEATAQARKQTARDLDSPNIYLLLSHGSELYDSSFRDILVPVLLKRINSSFNANLLNFLVQTDPLNNFVSDFIISCAQKGKLTAFFPSDSREQQKILDLMAQSAFQDEQSLILFSATFTTLLEKLRPEARSYLVEKMITTIRQSESTFALQLRVILQYYLNKHPDLLLAADLQKIAGLIGRYGTVDLSPYQTTDFKRWKQDGRLSSLSIFQHDDDGKISYVSNSKNLIRNGYVPHLSTSLKLLPEKSALLSEAERLISRERQRPDSAIGDLYRLSVKAPIVVEWNKEVNGIELSHAVTVYQDKFRQRQLLKQFLQAGMEMFAQRGHSYWREEQILVPMRHLLDSGQITAENIHDINRFMSIGSCGGIRVYSELNKLFNNTVDIFATVGTGKAIVNDPYNQRLFEIVAFSEDSASWEEIAHQSESIFEEGRGSDYLLPGSLPAILHKMMDVRNIN